MISIFFYLCKGDDKEKREGKKLKITARTKLSQCPVKVNEVSLSQHSLLISFSTTMTTTTTIFDKTMKYISSLANRITLPLSIFLNSIIAIVNCYSLRLPFKCFYRSKPKKRKKVLLRMEGWKLTSYFPIIFMYA